MTPHMYVLNQRVVPVLDWYFLIRIGCGTGRRPTNVPCCRNFKISDSSVRPLKLYTSYSNIIDKTSLKRLSTGFHSRKSHAYPTTY